LQNRRRPVVGEYPDACVTQWKTQPCAWDRNAQSLQHTLVKIAGAGLTLNPWNNLRGSDVGSVWAIFVPVTRAGKVANEDGESLRLYFGSAAALIFMLESLASRRSKFTDVGLQFLNGHDNPSGYMPTFVRTGRSRRYIPEFAFNDEMLRHVILFRAWRFLHAKRPMPPIATLNYRLLDASCTEHAKRCNRWDWQNATTKCSTYMSWLGIVAYSAWRLRYFSSEISRDLNVSYSSVIRTINGLVKVAGLLGFPTRARGHNYGKRLTHGFKRRPMDLRRVLAMRNANEPVSAIAKATGESTWRIRKALRENGYELSITLGNKLRKLIPEAIAAMRARMKAFHEDPEFKRKWRAASIKDLTGQRFGFVVVVGDSGERSKGSIKWKCQCDCGKTAKLSAGDLRSRQRLRGGCGSICAARKADRAAKVATNGTTQTQN